MTKHKLPFDTAAGLEKLIRQYFKQIAGKFHFENKAGKSAGENIKQKIFDREPEPATFTGLAAHLGFTSRQEMENYQGKGGLAALVKRARLQVEAEYEKKLHYPSPTGAIFALKSMGWTEKQEMPATDKTVRSLTMKIVDSGPMPANNEKEVML